MTSGTATGLALLLIGCVLSATATTRSLFDSDRVGRQRGRQYLVPNFVSDDTIGVAAVRMWSQRDWVSGLEILYTNGEVVHMRDERPEVLGGFLFFRPSLYYELVLDRTPGRHEVIRMVRGRASDRVYSLEFRTSKGRSISFAGRGSGAQFSQQWPQESGRAFVGVSASVTEESLNSLTVVSRDDPVIILSPPFPAPPVDPVSFTASFGAGAGETFPFSRSIFDTSAYLLSVRIWGDNLVRGMQFVYSSGDNSKHGECRGPMRELILRDGEYIAEANGRKGKFLDKVTFTTNQARSISVGGNGGGVWTLAAISGYEIVGFSGGIFLEALFTPQGIVSQNFARVSFSRRFFRGNTNESVFRLRSDQSFGGNGGTVFSFADFVRDGTVQVMSVRMWADSKVNGLEFEYTNGVTATHGGTSGTMTELALSPGEFVSSCEGRSGDVVNRLVLRSNKNRVISGGGTGGQRFQFFAPPIYDDMLTWEIAGVSGKSDSNLDKVSVVWRSVSNVQAVTYTTSNIVLDFSRQTVISTYDTTLGSAEVENRTNVTQSGVGVEDRFTVSQTTTLTDSLTRSLAVGAGLTQSIAVKGTLFGAELTSTTSISFTSEVTTTTTNSESVSSTTSRTAVLRVSLNVPPQSRIRAESIGSYQEVSVPYTAQVEVTTRDGATQTMAVSGTASGTAIHTFVRFVQLPLF